MCINVCMSHSNVFICENKMQHMMYKCKYYVMHLGWIVIITVLSVIIRGWNAVAGKISFFT